jgi:outer membrane protein TolC
MKATRQHIPGWFTMIILLLIPFGVFAQEKEEGLLTLTDCIQTALKNNSQLKSTEFMYQAAGYDVIDSYQGILPTISASAGKSKVETGPAEYLGNSFVGLDADGNAIYEQVTIKNKKDSRESSSASLSVNETLFDGGIWWNQIRKAKADERAAKYDFENARNGVILEVQTAYFDLIKQMKLLEVYQIAVRRSEGQLDRANKMFELGASARVDVFRAKVNLGNDRITELTQQTIVDQAKKRLNLAMGRDPLTDLQVDTSIALETKLAGVEDLIQQAMSEQPLIKKNEESIHSRAMTVKMAKGVNYPRFSVFINHNRFHETTAKVFSDFDKNYQTTFGLNVSLNLFNGFSDYVNLQKAQINQKVARENLEEYKRNLQSGVSQYYDSYKMYIDIIQINKENLEAAQEELRLAEERYQIGAGTSLEVREAQVNLTRAEQALVASEFNKMLLLAQLDNQIGLTYKKALGNNE